MITLDMPTILRAARKAFDAGELQAQNPDFVPPAGARNIACFYSGPCAIGAAIPKELALQLDNALGDTGILEQIRLGRIIMTDDSEQVREDLADLQDVHDAWANDTGGTAGRFERLLVELEGKYL